MRIVLFQSCDGSGFSDVLDATARANKEFCRRHDVAYRSFTGLKRGLWPWHACFNRLYMLKELIDEGHDGWALHLDGDAYVCDLNFPIRDYLGKIAHKAGVAVLSGATDAYWDINAGVLFFNLGHPTAIAMVNEWIDRHEKIFSEPEFLSRQWHGFDDQRQMHVILQEHPEWSEDLHIESQSVINSMHASFIRHHLRSISPDFRKRVESIRREVEEVMEKDRLLGAREKSGIRFGLPQFQYLAFSGEQRMNFRRIVVGLLILVIAGLAGAFYIEWKMAVQVRTMKAFVEGYVFAEAVAACEKADSTTPFKWNTGTNTAVVGLNSFKLTKYTVIANYTLVADGVYCDYDPIKKKAGIGSSFLERED